MTEDEAIPDEDGPEGEDQEGEALVNGVEQEDAPLEGNQYLNELVEDDGTQSHPYPWDNELDEQVHPVTPSIKMGAIHISSWRYGREEGNNLAHHPNSDSANHATHGQHTAMMHATHASDSIHTSCAIHAGPSKHCHLVGAKSSGNLLLYNYHAHKHMGT